MLSRNITQQRHSVDQVVGTHRQYLLGPIVSPLLFRPSRSHPDSRPELTAAASVGCPRFEQMEEVLVVKQLQAPLKLLVVNMCVADGLCGNRRCQPFRVFCLDRSCADRSEIIYLSMRFHSPPTHTHLGANCSGHGGQLPPAKLEKAGEASLRLLGR